MTPRALWLVAAAVIAVTGCSSTSKPTVVPPLPSVSATASPTPRASTVTLPSTARVQDSHGASAFVKFWFASLDRAYQSGSLFPVAQLSDTRCKSCLNFAKAAEELHRDGTHLRGITFQALQAEASIAGPGLAYVSVTSDLPSRSEVNAAGRVVRTFPPDKRLQLVVIVMAVPGGWTLRAMRPGL